jgi:hypothetical protein
MSGHNDLSLADVLLYEAGLDSGRLEGAAEIARLSRELEEARARGQASREALTEAVRWAIRQPNDQHAFHQCRYCDLTWWGEAEGRTNPERERHNTWCLVPGWRKALATPQEASDG